LLGLLGSAGFKVLREVPGAFLLLDMFRGPHLARLDCVLIGKVREPFLLLAMLRDLCLVTLDCVFIGKVRGLFLPHAMLRDLLGCIYHCNDQARWGAPRPASMSRTQSSSRSSAAGPDSVVKLVLGWSSAAESDSLVERDSDAEPDSVDESDSLFGMDPIP